MPRRPKMIAVQAEGCQPVVRAFEKEPRTQHSSGTAPPPSPAGFACRSRWAIALMLEPCGRAAARAIAVSDEALIDAGIRLAEEEGIFAAPEGAACVAAAQRLIAEGFLKHDDRIVIYNTGSGLKYLEAYSTRFPRTASGETDKLGGLITPR